MGSHYSAYTSNPKTQQSKPSVSFTPEPPTIQPQAQHPQQEPPKFNPDASIFQTDLDNPYAGLFGSAAPPTAPASPSIQAKLTVGAIGDKYEQEADTVAAQVVRTINSPQPSSVMQREGEEEEELQMKPLKAGDTASPSNFVVGAVDDAAEHEADQVAAAFSESQGKTASIQRLSESPPPSNAPAASIGAEGGVMNSDMEQAVSNAKTGGKSLDGDSRTKLEGFFGSNLANVRIHDNPASERVSRMINASAFTLGNDIFYGAKAPRPGSPEGDHLLAHEVTHVAQQGGVASRSFSVRRSPVGIRRSYAALGPTQKKQVDAKAESDYYEYAGAFEVALGKAIAATSAAQKTAKDMSNRVKTLVDKWAKMVAWNLNETYVSTFGIMSATETGSVPAFAEDIKAVFKSGSLRERLTLVYSAIRSDNLQMLLQAAYQDISATGKQMSFKWKGESGAVSTFNKPKGFAKKAGLSKHLKKNTDVTSDIRDRIDPNKGINERSQLFNRGKMITDVETTGEKQKVAEQYNSKAVSAHQTLEESDLSERELRNQVNHLIRMKGYAPLTKKAAAKLAQKCNQTPMQWLESEYKKLQAELQPDSASNGQTPTQWVSGENWYRSQVDSKMTEQASKVKAKLRSSISGTTDMFLHASQYLGMSTPKDLAKVRLAMLAWMLPARDHTFYEIMTAATQYGLTDYDPQIMAWENYEKPIAPLKKSTNVAAAKDAKALANAPAGKFPGWYLSPPGYNDGGKEPSYKDQLAQQWLPTSGLMVRGEPEMAVFLNAGAPKNLINHMADPAWNAAKQLLAAVAKAKWTGDDQAKQLVFNNITALPCYTALTDFGGPTLLAAFVNKFAPGFMPDSHKPFLTHAKLLTPMGKGERFTSDEIEGFDPATSKALINPEWGTKGSGEKSKDSAYRINKQKFIEDVIKYDPGKYRDDPTQMNAWFETYGRKLEAAFPGTDLLLLKSLNLKREQVKGTEDEALWEDVFDKAYQKVFQLKKLSEQEKIALNLYSVSRVANDVNAASRGNAAKLEQSGDTAQLIVSALEQLQPWTGGPVYRGDADRGFRVGAVINYNEFVSTAKTVKSSFINKSGMSWATHAVVIEKHRSGKDIMALSGYSHKTFEKMEGEILFPPGVQFVVKRIEDWTHLKSPTQDKQNELKQVLQQIKDKKTAGEDTSALEATKTQLQKDIKQIPTRSELINKVWVYLDEV